MPFVPQVALHVDVYDCIKVWEWSCAADVHTFIAHCAKSGIHHLYWRLSIVGTFLHHTKIERQMPNNAEHHHIELSHRMDLLETGVEAAKKYGVKIYPWITMFDEGFAPRLNGQQPVLEEYFFHHDWPVRVMNDSLILCDGIPHPEKWFDSPVPPGFESVIPAVEQSQGCDPKDPWSMYSLFAKNYPQYLTSDRYGTRLGRVLGLSYPEVRKYKLSLIREVMDYGCDGVCLDFTRWPGEHDVKLFDEDVVNVFGYDGPAVSSFQDTYGQNPATMLNSDPRWVQHRCDCGATRFLRDLREMAGSNFSIHTMVYLTDNIKEAFLDTTTWMKNNLVDKVIPFGHAERYGILNRAVDSPHQPPPRRKTYKEWFYEWSKNALIPNKVEFAVNMGVFSDSPSAVYSQRLLSDATLREYIELCRDYRLGGLALYEACHVRKSHMSVIEEFLNHKSTPCNYEPDFQLVATHIDPSKTSWKVEVKVLGNNYLPDRMAFCLNDFPIQDVSIAPATIGRWSSVRGTKGEIPDAIVLESADIQNHTTLQVDAWMGEHKTTTQWDIRLDKTKNTLCINATNSQNR